MLSDRFWQHGMKYIAEMFQYHTPEYQQVAWRANLDEKYVTDEAFGKAVKFIGGSLKQWNQTTNLAALVMEYVEDVYRPQARIDAINARVAWPKQLKAATPDGNVLLEFHKTAYAYFRKMADGEDGRKPGESVHDYVSRMNQKFLSECRKSSVAIPRQYAEAWQ